VTPTFGCPKRRPVGHPVTLAVGEFPFAFGDIEAHQWCFDAQVSASEVAAGESRVAYISVGFVEGFEDPVDGLTAGVMPVTGQSVRLALMCVRTCDEIFRQTR
jgi:hypothetical protein